VVTEPATWEEFPFPFLPVLTGAGRWKKDSEMQMRKRGDAARVTLALSFRAYDFEETAL